MYQSRVSIDVTPSNASQAEVLMVVQDKEYVQWPKLMKTDPKKKDPDKYCQFHKIHRHDTNNCYQLLYEIERLIKRGHLKNFVRKVEELGVQLGNAEVIVRK